MTVRSLKLLFLLIVAAFEVTLLHLGVSLIAIATSGGTNSSWLVLLLTCLISAFTTARFTPHEDQPSRFPSPWTILICALTVGYGVKLQAGGGWSLLSGWATLLPFGANQPPVGLGSATLLLTSLAAWWRGTAVVDHDHDSVAKVLQWGVVGLVLLTFALTPVTMVNLGEAPWGSLLAIEAVLAVGFGMLSLSLARIVEATDIGGTASAWAWFRSSLTVTIGILALGTLVLSLFSDSATLAVRLLLGGIGLLAALLFAPLAALLDRFAQWLRSGAGEALIPPPPQGSPLGSASPIPTPNPGALQLGELLTIVLTVALYLLPLIALVLLILFARRRRRDRPTADGELHESLWNWRDVGADLLGMLRDLRPQGGPGGLRGALARLRGESPAERVRRRYIQLLLLGEGLERQRKPEQTPLEHVPALSSVAPAATGALQQLTEHYDRARYAPDSITPATAAAADEAWATIETRTPKENR